MNPFDEAAFPALLESLKVDKDGTQSEPVRLPEAGQPPILHRKELLLPPDDVRLPRFRALTRRPKATGSSKTVTKPEPGPPGSGASQRLGSW